MIDMAGIDWSKGPEGGIYLMAGDTSASQVARAGGKRLRTGVRGKAGYIKGWDGGRFVPGDVKTTADAIEATGLGWLVEKHPILKVTAKWGVSDEGLPELIGWEPRKSKEAPAHKPGTQRNPLPHGGWDIVPDETMNVREDTGEVLGIVGPGWQGPQNHEAFEFVDALVDSGDAKWLGGGESAGGRRVWMVAQLAREVLIGGDANERSIPLMFVSNGWDGFTPLAITAAPYRLACLNGQTIPLEGHVRSWKIRHTTNHATRLQLARDTLELNIGYFDSWAAEMEKLIKGKLAEPAAEKLIVKLFPDANLKRGKDGKLSTSKTAQANVEAKREQVLTILRTSDDLANVKGTKYGLFNAVTEFADWHVKGPAEKQVLRSAEPSALKDKAYALLAG